MPTIGLVRPRQSRATWASASEAFQGPAGIDAAQPLGVVCGLAVFTAHPAEPLASEAASLRLDARDLYHPVPLRRLGRDVGFELRGAQHHRNRADIGKPCPDVRLR